MHNNYILGFVYFIFLSLGMSQAHFEFLGSGGNQTKNNILINPSWGVDSRTFTVEKFNAEYASKISSLKIGRIDDDFKIILEDVYKEENKGSKFKKRGPRYYERNAGWLNYDDEYQIFITVTGANYKFNSIYVNKSPEEFDLDSGDIEVMLDPAPDFLAGEPAFFSTSNDRFYFVSLSLDDEIFFTNTVDEGLDKIYPVGLKSLDLVSLPIRSIAVSNDNSDLIFVTYSEALSKIYHIPIDINDTSMKFNTPVEIQKPDNTLNYFSCLRHPNMNSRYILIGSNNELDTKNSAYAFIMNDGVEEGKFLFYRHREDNASYIAPEIQFDPSSNKIYFLKPTSNNEKILSFWDGEKINETDMDLKNIRDFKISPDGERLLVVTFEPKDMYIYKINK